MIKEDKSKGIFLGGNSDLNRQLLESKSTKVVVLNHSHNKRDSLYERDSGLNQVLCNLAKDKDISFVINLDELLVSDLKLRSEILSRIIQNVFLINKFHNNLRVVFPSSWDSRDVQAFLLTIGSSTSLAKSSVSE